MSDVTIGSIGASESHSVPLPLIPSSWYWATPRELASTDDHSLAIGPFGSNLKVSDYQDEGVPLIFVRNIRQNEYCGPSTKFVSETKAQQLAAHTVDPGDVLVTKMGDPPGDAEVYPLGAPRAVITADCLKFRVDHRLGLSRFFVHAINSRIGRTQIALITKGVAQQKVSLGRFARLRLPVPPLAEQSRIVEKIEELLSDLDAGVAALKRAKANLKRYRAAVLKAAVEGRLTEQWRADHPDAEPASQLLHRILTERRQKWEANQLAKFAYAGKAPPKNWREKYVEPTPPDTNGLPGLPEGWCWASLDQLCQRITDGEHLSPKTTDSGVMLLSAKDVREHGVELDDTKYVSEEDAKRFRERCNPELNDVLVVSRGATIGRTSVVQVDYVFCLMGSVILLKSVGIEVNSKMLAYWLRETNCQRKLVAVSGSTAQQAIYIRDIRPLVVVLPPQAEQCHVVEEIEEQISKIEAAETQIDHGLHRAARLRQSILKQAFEGKLVPQDPTDEPASMLLERLRASREVHGGSGRAATPTRGSRGKSKRIEEMAAE
jgi:type I restriction enzyme, S subunit